MRVILLYIFIACDTLMGIYCVSFFNMNLIFFNNCKLSLLYYYYMKTSGTCPRGENKFIINCFWNPQAPVPRKKYNSEKQQTVDCVLKPIQRSGTKHSLGKVIPQRTWAVRYYA